MSATDAEFFRIALFGDKGDATFWVQSAQDPFDYALGTAFRNLEITNLKSSANIFPKQSAIETAALLKRIYPELTLESTTFAEWIDAGFPGHFHMPEEKPNHPVWRM